MDGLCYLISFQPVIHLWVPPPPAWGVSPWVGLWRPIQAGSRLCSLVCLSRASRPAARTAEHTPRAYHTVTRSLPASRRRSGCYPGRNRAIPRRLLLISGRENYRLGPQTAAVRAGRWEESCEARAPVTLPLSLGRSPLTTTTFAPSPGRGLWRRAGIGRFGAGVA